MEEIKTNEVAIYATKNVTKNFSHIQQLMKNDGKISWVIFVKANLNEFQYNCSRTKSVSAKCEINTNKYEWKSTNKDFSIQQIGN